MHDGDFRLGPLRRILIDVDALIDLVDVDVAESQHVASRRLAQRSIQSASLLAGVPDREAVRPTC